jgi:hypothetical protein
MIRRTCATAAAVAALVIPLTAVTASPASAGIEKCNLGYFCVWAGTGYTGTFIYAGGSLNTSNYANSGLNDMVSSLYNHGSNGQGVNVYVDANYRGSSLCIPIGVAVSNLGVYGFDNVISSHYWTATCHS